MKVQKIITLLLSSATVLVVGAGAILKISGNQEIVATMAKMGVGPYVNILGVSELVFLGLFLYHPTRKVGFILLACYFAGAIATELANRSPLNALLPQILLWLTAFARDSNIFVDAKAED